MIFKILFTPVRIVLRVLLCLLIAVVAVAVGVNAWVIFQTKDAIYSDTASVQQAVTGKTSSAVSGAGSGSVGSGSVGSGSAGSGSADSSTTDGVCAVVLGAAVQIDGAPTAMLKHRLDDAILLYKDGAVNSLLMTGFGLEEYYNEVDVMAAYAVDHGVSKDDIFLDRMGINTIDSMKHAARDFNFSEIIVVTQPYHLPRSMYSGIVFGQNVIGFSTDEGSYNDQLYYDAREFLARVKDFFLAWYQQLWGFALQEIETKNLDSNYLGDKLGEAVDMGYNAVEKLPSAG